MELVELFTIIGVVIIFSEIRFRQLSKCIVRIEVKTNEIHKKVYHEG